MSTQPVENQGIMSSIGNGIDKILSLPDSPNSPTIRKVVRIVFDILIMTLGVVVFMTLTKGHFSSLANPSITLLMTMPLCGAIVGLGAAWLLQDIIGKKYQRTASKISAIIVPIFLAAGAACLVGAGFHSGVFTTTSMGGWYFVGLLTFPLAFFFTDRAIDECKKSKVTFINGPPPAFEYTRRRHLSQEKQEEMERLATSQKDTSTSNQVHVQDD